MEYKAKEAYKSDSVARTYDSMRFTSIKGRLTDLLEKRAIMNAINAARLVPQARVLDIPCGTGRLSLYLAHMGFIVTAADVSPSMISTFRDKIINTGFQDRLKFEIEDAERLKFCDHSFDIVVSLRLFGHVPPKNRLSMLKEFNRVSRGQLVLAYYQSDNIQGLIRTKKRKESGISWYPVTIKELYRELDSAGLKASGLFPIFPFFPWMSETLVVLAEPK